MKELSISIDFPSCKYSGFSSEDFSSALKDDFINSQYILKILYPPPQNGAFRPCGFSTFLLTGEEETEREEIHSRICRVFENLVHLHKNNDMNSLLE